MKNLSSFKPVALVASFCLSTSAFSQTLVHYWNFNNNTSASEIVKPTVSLVTGASLVAESTPPSSGVIDAAGGTGQNFNVENLNARNGDASGTHLRFNNPIGGSLTFKLPTTGYRDAVVKFATRRSGSGAGTQKWFYTTDGINFNALTTITVADANPALQTLDFTSLDMTDNNPNFALKVLFERGAGGDAGNNRFDNFTLDAASSGGADTTAPTVTFGPANAATGVSTAVNPTISFSENIRLIDNSAITNANAANILDFRQANATGTPVPFTATISGTTITVKPSVPLKPNQAYYLALKPNTVEDFSDNAITASASATFTTSATTVAFAKTLVKVNENAGTLDFVLNITSPSDSSVNLVVKPAPYSTADSNDFTLATQKISITPATPASYHVSIPIINDSAKEQEAEYFVLSLEDANGVAISGSTFSTVYIIDDDNQAPIPDNEITLKYIGSFDPSGSNNSTTEIVVHDPASKRLFTTSAVTGVFDIIDFKDPTAPVVLKTVDMKPYGGVTSIAVKNGMVAVASPATVPQQNGSAVFFDTSGNFLKQVTVGALPDMITFTPDGKKVLTANEGEPNADYSIDPEGSVSIIDLSNGVSSLTQANVSTLLFTNYNSQEAALVSSGIRKLKASSSLSQDLEPEYIAVSKDSSKAWVTIQENNAIAEIDLNAKNYTALWPLGKKDMSKPGYGFDASDNNGEVLIANWPVKSFYIPDGIATYNVNGTNYVITANEGDEKEFANLNERIAVGDAKYVLDPAVFPQAEVLKASGNLGRFRATNLNGNLDPDAEFEEINSVGARSFSIFNADAREIVFDSGDDFERYTAKNYPSIFNADHSDSNTPKVRSRAKGPEPEGVATAEINGYTYAFISLERVGGVVVYNVSNPNEARFVDYKNTRSTSAYGGDNGAEGITYIPAAESATGKPYIVVANEISGTLTIYEIANRALGTTDTKAENTFNVFPNPAPKGTLYFNREADVKVYDMAGNLLQTAKKAKTLDTARFEPGVYLIKTAEGQSRRFMVKP